ncbi:MAG TPA: primosomal protein N', partial [bacterium]|nr:primosomal protein N' [bacterium]
VGILHSGLSSGERFDEWSAAREGRVRVIVGTRSAVFCPLDNIGLIVVDEEHDPSYKQDDPAPRYHARDVAAYRAAAVGAVAVFGSATPSLESYWNSRTGKYDLLTLPERAVQHGLPELSLIDMRARAENESVVSQELVDACRACLDRSEQAILFLNRRGFATNLLCRHCGETITCEKCSVALVYHQDQRRLRCHHCGFSRPEPTRCPSCSQEWLKYKGVGTEQVVEVMEQLLPGVRVGRMDTDTVQTRTAYNDLFSALARGEMDILVGTQMIAKGLDFGGVSLVGVICADMALFFEDFRAAERTFALLTQVAGRAGRGRTAGKVLIQTYCPQHYSVRAALDQNYQAFFDQEIRYRKLLSLPPYRRLVNIRISSGEEAIAKATAFELSNAIRLAFDELGIRTVRIIGPGECPIYRVRNQFRWQLAIAGRSQTDNARVLTHAAVQKHIRSAKSKLKITVDVDPQSFL